MNYLVAYLTETGNTKLVAEAIFGALPDNKALRPLHEVDTLDGFDLVFIGFPVKKFGVPPAARRFILSLAAGKKIALFVTHAMLSNPDDDQQKEMLNKELDKCRDACLNSELAGLYHCQGELSGNTANELMASNIPMLMEFAGMRRFTMGHPDEDELQNAREFARGLATS